MKGAKPFELVPYEWKVVTNRGKTQLVRVWGKCESRRKLRTLTGQKWSDVNFEIDNIQKNPDKTYTITGKKLRIGRKDVPVTILITNGGS
jgi:hypothetical protein